MEHLSVKNIKIIKNINLFLDKDDYPVKLLSKNTQNTWQKDRKNNEKRADTNIGKLAENIFEQYLEKQIRSLRFFSYDSFRKDNFRKHAPFDGIILRNNYDKNIVRTYARKIISEIENNKYGIISDKLKIDLEKNEIFTVEIKSTRVSQRLRENTSSEEQIAENIINNDDFLDYPKYLRNDNDNKINSLQDYIEFCKKHRNLICETNNCENSIRTIEKNNMKYFYVRVYIDEIHKTAYIIGYIDKVFFSDNFFIKHMSKKGKSEKAIYLTNPLKNAKNIDELQNI